MRTRLQDHGTTGLRNYGTTGRCDRPTVHAQRSTESGVALVITLILLAVITFMAATFLVVTRGEHNNVQADTDDMMGQLALEAAMQDAQAQMLASIEATLNPYAPAFTVSTNYISSVGFIKSGLGYSSFTNVSYTYPDGTPVRGSDDLQNLANLRYFPRAPVFVTNRTAANSNDFRWYYDLNQNGRPEPNGWQPVISTNPALPYFDANWNLVSVSNNNIQRAFFMGDPEWIGLLERPSYPPSLYGLFTQGFGHSSSNRFVGRYAFMVVPSSLTLDINTMHNFGKWPLAQNGDLRTAGDGFLRNMGVGTYENSLASFLVDLNTNYWAPTNGNPNVGWYHYIPNNTSVPNTGAAFDDAAGFFRYRVATNWVNGFASVQQLFGNSGANIFRRDYIDGYSSGPIMTAFRYPTDGDANVLPNEGWPGAESRNRYFDSQDLFNPNKAPATFTARLKSAASQIDSYNRYTFYRMLQQLGTDSAPEHGKINLNYNNTLAGQVVPDRATNMVSWSPLEFFTNAAIRMLSQAGFDTNVISNGQIHIQLYPTNYYFPSVHRLLQVAANIYDFTTNQGDSYPYYPSVFRPVFSDSGGVGSNSPVFITGYVELTDDSFVTKPPPFHELANPLDRRGGGTNVMYYGVPLVIGAKKGFPNFNGFSLQSDTMITRKLLFGTDPLTRKTNSISQAYSIGISNAYGVEAWNSYFTNYPRQLEVISRVEIGMGLSTNRTDFVTRPAGGFQTTNYNPPFVTVLSNVWPGSALRSGTFQPATASFSVPIRTNWVFLPTNNFLTYSRHLTTDTNASDGNGLFPVPHLLLNVTSRVRFALVDTASHRIVDYANLLATDPPVDLMDLCQRPQPDQAPGGDPGSSDFSRAAAAFFTTNRQNGSTSDSVMTEGIRNQFLASIGGLPGGQVAPVVWNAFKAPGISGNQAYETGKFRNRILDPRRTDPPGPFQTPFNPYRVIHHYVSWQANDPLVHYMVPDLLDGMYGLKTNQMDGVTDKSPMPNLARINNNYRPWSVNGESGADTTPASKLNIGFKDSLVGRSDDWDWPTNKYFKFPTIGWLGQVHRGTPWQTVDFKAPVNVTTKTNTDGSVTSTPDGSWGKWVAHDLPNWDGYGTTRQDSTLTDPTNDYRFVDLFTTAFNDSSTRGQLSINQPGLAAWSGVLGGVVVATSTNGSYSVIEPAGIYNPNPAFASNWPALYTIVSGINRMRTNVVHVGTTNAFQFQNGTYQRLGDILNVPELTTASPLLPRTAAGMINTNIISDAVYERLPQQILNLLRGGDQPRFVIYAFGQGLRPAPNSRITAPGPYYQMCTNYSVTSEVAARAVVRVEGSADPAQANNPNPLNRYPPRLVVESYNVLPPY